MNKRTVIAVDGSTHERLRKLCETEKYVMSGLVDKVLNEWLDNRAGSVDSAGEQGREVDKTNK